MKQYSRLISLVGGVISFFSFALPWVEDSSGFKLVNISSSNSNVGFVVIVFIVTLIIIVTSLILTGLTQPMVGVLCKRAGNLKSAENYIVFVLILDQIMKTV